MTPDKLRAAAEARALKTMLLIAAKAGWRFSRGPITANCFAAYSYVEAAQLLLAPTTSGLPFARRQLDPVIRDARSDALIISRSTEAEARFAFASWGFAETRWTPPLTLWLAVDGAAWLVPGPDEHDELGIRLVDRLHRVEGVPWTNQADRWSGYTRARVWMARTAGMTL